MKKILLIIFTIILILSVNVLAVDIDIGCPAINRGSSIGPNTIVNKSNPAEDTGIITSVEIWALNNLENCEVATFYVVSGNNLSTRDSQAIGAVTAGSKQTFVVSLDVVAGDYIGMYYSSGKIEVDTSGYSGIWYAGGDNIPCTNNAFTLADTYAMSLYGTGIAEEEEGINVLFFGTNF